MLSFYCSYFIPNRICHSSLLKQSLTVHRASIFLMSWVRLLLTTNSSDLSKWLRNRYGNMLSNEHSQWNALFRYRHFLGMFPRLLHAGNFLWNLMMTVICELICGMLRLFTQFHLWFSGNKSDICSLQVCISNIVLFLSNDCM